MRNYAYTILLTITLIIALGTKGYTYLSSKAGEPTPSAPIEANTSSNSNDSEQQEATKDIASSNHSSKDTTSTEAIPEEHTTEVEIEKGPAPVENATLEYFDNTLFIGDSRTVGLSEYGGLGNADVFADNGMNVYKIWNSNVTLNTGEKTTLEPLLNSKKYDKIYIMLGINELGYDYEQTVREFEKFMKKIQEFEPSAIIYIEANLHVTKEKSDSSDVYNNQNIDRFNEAIGQLADNQSRFYIDINEVFDDQTGSLSKEYTFDAAHILGKYYKDWVNWLLTKAVE